MRTCILFCCSLYFCHLKAQQPAIVSLSSITRTDSNIEFIFNGDRPFYMGDNMYILHIGENDFTYSHQTTINTRGQLTFFIPEKQYDQLKSGSFMWLSYGNPLSNMPEADIEEFCSRNPGIGWIFQPFTVLTR